jgi:hypothetical protein
VEWIECLERVLVNPFEGYAGRVDLIAKIKGVGWSVVDFKTQKIKRSPKGEPKPAFYETWPLQLAAYLYAAKNSIPRQIDGLVSLVIDSSQPGPMHVKVWAGVECEAKDAEWYYERFLAVMDLWMFVKDYKPAMAGNLG